MPQPYFPDNEEAILRELDRRIRALEQAPVLQSSAITVPGSLQVRRADGSAFMYVGNVVDQSYPSGEPGLLIYRTDGSLALGMFTPAGQTQQSISLFDHSGNEISGEDTASGFGLSRPYIPMHWMNADMSTANHTTSATFTDLEICNAPAQHPKVYWQGLVVMDASTSGEVRMYDHTNNVQVGSTQAIGSGASAYVAIGPSALTSPGFMVGVNLAIQGRVTAGAGKISVRTLVSFGRQS